MTSGTPRGTCAAIVCVRWLLESSYSQAHEAQSLLADGHAFSAILRLFMGRNQHKDAVPGRSQTPRGTSDLDRAARSGFRRSTLRTCAGWLASRPAQPTDVPRHGSGPDSPQEANHSGASPRSVCSMRHASASRRHISQFNVMASESCLHPSGAVLKNRLQVRLYQPVMDQRSTWNSGPGNSIVDDVPNQCTSIANFKRVFMMPMAIGTADLLIDES